MDFHAQEEYTLNDIQNLISNQAVESIHLEFKSGSALGKGERETREIAKDVSAFANSDGGIIIYGVNEKNNHADSLSPVVGNIFSKEWLEQIIQSKIEKRIQNLRIYPIRIDADNDKTVYVVKIPRSPDAPHMSADKRYYRRYNFSSVPMEEYEVRDLFYRKTSSNLIVAGCWLIKTENDKDEQLVRLNFSSSIHNDSREVEKTYKVNVYLEYEGDFPFKDITWDALKDSINYSTRYHGIKISSAGTMPLFPNESIDICRFSILLHPYQLQHFTDDVRFTVRVFYPGGDDYKEYTASELLNP